MRTAEKVTDNKPGRMQGYVYSPANFKGEEC